MNDERVPALVVLLRDRSARPDERDDAAIDLGETEDARSIDALLSVGSAVDENEIVASSCGESLAYIASRQRDAAAATRWLSVLSDPAAAEFKGSLTALCPGLLS